MNSITNLSSTQLRLAADLKDKIQALEQELGQIMGSSAESPAPVERRKRRKMSAAGRARIIAAQKARWAKVKGKKLSTKPATKTKRKMGAAARAKISAAAKKRWAKAKAAGKTKL